MTSILALPQLAVPCSVGTNEDWTDGWAYLDPDGNPIPGTGIALDLMLRRTAADATVAVVAASGPASLSGLPLNGALAWGGSDGNLVVLAIPAATMQKVPTGTYVGEVLASADGHRRSIALLTVTIVQGVVR